MRSQLVAGSHRLAVISTAPITSPLRDHSITYGSVLNPGRTAPCRMRRFRSSFIPSCRQTLRRLRGTVSSFDLSPGGLQDSPKRLLGPKVPRNHLAPSEVPLRGFPTCLKGGALSTPQRPWREYGSPCRLGCRQGGARATSRG